MRLLPDSPLSSRFFCFVRIHKTLRMTPAMAAGLSKDLRDVEWIVGLMDARAAKPRRPKSYRPRISN